MRRGNGGQWRLILLDPDAAAPRRRRRPFRGRRRRRPKTSARRRAAAAQFAGGGAAATRQNTRDVSDRSTFGQYLDRILITHNALLSPAPSAFHPSPLVSVYK